MLPSEQLRLEISQEQGLNLEQYAWDQDFQQRIFQIELDKELETSADNLGQIYSLGYNIGHCGLTSRYIVRTFENAKLHYGKSKILVGTDSSPDGEHAWTILDECIIDTTLMMIIPIEKAKEFGYISEKEILPASAKVLSEYDTYEIEFKKNKQHTKK